MSTLGTAMEPEVGTLSVYKLIVFEGSGSALSSLKGALSAGCGVGEAEHWSCQIEQVGPHGP